MSLYIPILTIATIVFFISVIFLWSTRRGNPGERKASLLMVIVTSVFVLCAFAAEVKYDVNSKIRKNIYSRLYDQNANIYIFNQNCTFRDKTWYSFSYDAKSRLGNGVTGFGFADVDQHSNLIRVWITDDPDDKPFIAIYEALHPGSSSTIGCLDVGDKALDLLARHATSEDIDKASDEIKSHLGDILQ